MSGRMPATSRDPDDDDDWERMFAPAAVGGDRRPRPFHFVRQSLNSLLMAIMAISELVVVAEAHLQLQRGHSRGKSAIKRQE